jgi:hypothetical protein
MPDGRKRLELWEVIKFVARLTTLRFTASCEVHVWEFNLSKVGGSYQLH